MEVKVLNKQTIYDISIQHTGTVDNAFAIALKNKISISQKLSSGMVLTIPDELTKDNKVLQYLKARNIIPATGLTKQQILNIEDYEFPQGEFPISL